MLDGIPVFSARDRYVDNYTQIAADHVAAVQQGNENPFIDNDLWVELENSTRTLVRKYVADGARVLDVGVGLGRVLGPLDSLQRYGIDISIDYLERARERGFEVAFSRIEDMPYEDGYFDAIVACDVLEHVIDLHRCCLQLLRVLRPGGVLIVRVPYLDDMAAYLDESLPYEFIHVRSFDVPSLRILFGKILGMQYEEHAFVAPYLKDALFKIKLLPDSSLAARLAQDATDSDHPLWILRKVTEVSQETFRNWIYALRDQKPALCRELLPELVEGLEVNIVFTKPN
ncbi:bifunctional 2-polyprenyl-6-hydroxyphenol methylase/3-demethylubiquinol 3-O-methyltransferase UbiG [Methyloversatilis sp.]|uniref:class I SAM-dependent methyltransferase n=1 Tax=Methyloversatilis sp. TaxID=2569862 RepID=UPI0027BA1C7C|nr:class I SAM-dependent methyltransferase [Methyloversatilis sp.]